MLGCESPPDASSPTYTYDSCSLSSGDVQLGIELIRFDPPGKALSLHAGAYSTCASEPLHPEAPGYRRELPADGEHPARATCAAVSPRTRATPAASRSVCCDLSPLLVLAGILTATHRCGAG